ncbi:MAG: hypothetical protein U0R44_01060 [Candidatus Micrarchaeia archaeon]
MILKHADARRGGPGMRPTTAERKRLELHSDLIEIDRYCRFGRNMVSDDDLVGILRNRSPKDADERVFGRGPTLRDMLYAAAESSGNQKVREEAVRIAGKI